MVEKSAVKKINTPLTEDIVLNLKIGDIVSISGRIVTGRDSVHKFLFHERPDKKEIPFDLEGGIIYHCGPIISKTDDAYKLIAAGPTTSMRVEMYEADIIKAYGIRGIIGKGGMGDKTLAALKECGCVYLHTISGAAAYLADRIKGTAGGWKIEEFGEPEAMWQLEVEEFPAMVTMDAHGNSLHREIERLSFERLKKMMA
ncbi:MAG TPA: fumarate hydrolyase [Nitrospiraceae bacterium]|nr:fumarate hydrolyase [Nitrospiraceae bacterium]HCL81768.1 fumarate hydrolyase [Nitrospiraceae bacterium]HCZ12007.1 fumarate hydrolyase [Nitrospiraceae bacterium]